MSSCDDYLSKLKAAVITLSMASIGSTMTFLKSSVAKDSELAMCMLKVSWILWAIAIVGTLLSYFADNQGESYRTMGENRNVSYTNAKLWFSVGGYSYIAGAVAFVLGLFVFVGAAVVGS